MASSHASHKNSGGERKQKNGVFNKNFVDNVTSEIYCSYLFVQYVFIITLFVCQRLSAGQ